MKTGWLGLYNSAEERANTESGTAFVYSLLAEYYYIARLGTIVEHIALCTRMYVYARAYHPAITKDR